MADRKMVQVDPDTHKKVKVYAADNGKSVTEVFTDGAALIMRLPKGAKSVDVYFEPAGGGPLKKKKIDL